MKKAEKEGAGQIVGRQNTPKMAKKHVFLMLQKHIFVHKIYKKHMHDTQDNFI
jgi:hypothetical protein